ncbi:MAG: M14 family metallopeptidase [Nitrospinaceae bacterium]
MKEKILSIPSPLGGPIDLYKNSWQATRAPDEVLSIVAGLHGDQVNGLILCSRLARFLDDIVEGRETRYRLRGWVRIFPVVNVNAVQTGARLWSLDDMDMDLSFPGNEVGEVSEQLARALVNHTADSTHGLILCTARNFYEDAPHLQCLQPKRSTRKMALGLGLERVRELPESPAIKLNLLYHWAESDMAALILSAGSPGRMDPALCDSLFDSIVNLMVSAGLISGPGPNNEKSRIRIHGVRDQYNFAVNCAGLFFPRVRVGTFLNQGDTLGEVRDVFSGQTLETLLVPEDGFLLTLRSHPVIYEKESAALMLREKKRGFWPF